jgi:prophage regulatory protein
MDKQIKIIRRKAVEAITGLGRSTIYAMMHDGKFPKPIQLSARAVGWVESEVADFLRQRIEASRDGGLR